MSKTILYRLFGVGKIPASAAEAIKNEGIVLMDEGVKGSVTYRNFRSPFRRANWKRQWSPASIALTKTRLVAFQYSSPIIDVPLNDARLWQMEFSLENENALLVRFDAALFHDDWSGTIEYRFKTPLAREFINKLSGLTV